MLCPVCSATTIRANNNTEQFCPMCHAEGREPLVSRMAGQKGREDGKRPQKGTGGHRRGNPEARLVADICKALRARGRTVLRIGQYRADLAGQTAGTPDLFCWTGAGWVGLEAKTAAGRLSPAQKALVQSGKVRVVRSVDEAIEIVMEEARNL